MSKLPLGVITQMRDDFAVLILTHGRPDSVVTLRMLKACGYTGRWYLVCDDEDKSLSKYIENFGKHRVLVFSKDEAARLVDQFDNAKDRRTITWARNKSFELARDVGIRYFVQLEDDYPVISYRWIGQKPGADKADYHGWVIRSLDKVFAAMVRFMEDTSAATIAMSQGGDHFGGKHSPNAAVKFMRKAMNSFVFDTERPVQFLGRLNDDVNTYVYWGRRGRLFFTFTPLQLQQEPTQTISGGTSELYKSIGTYAKSFYSVMVAPSCVKVSMMGRTDRRIHHKITWNNAVPKIVSEDLRRPRR
jgi:hypothetical protein